MFAQTVDEIGASLAMHQQRNWSIVSPICANCPTPAPRAEGYSTGLIHSRFIHPKRLVPPMFAVRWADSFTRLIACRFQRRCAPSRPLLHHQENSSYHGCVDPMPTSRNGAHFAIGPSAPNLLRGCHLRIRRRPPKRHRPLSKTPMARHRPLSSFVGRKATADALRKLRTLAREIRLLKARIETAQWERSKSRLRK